MKLATLAAALALLSGAAHAQSITLGAGANLYSDVDGRWMQQGVPGGSDVTRVAPVITLGITGPLVSRGRWGVDWHADYVNLGRAAATCMCTPSDDNYNPHTHQYVKHVDVDPAYFSGSGRSQGVAFTVEPYYWAHGLRFAAEAGAYVHYDQWSEYVAGWQVNRAVAPQTLNLAASYWSVAPVVGVSVGDGRWNVGIRHYFTSINSKRADVPPLWNDATTLTVTYRW